MSATKKPARPKKSSPNKTKSSETTEVRLQNRRHSILSPFRAVIQWVRSLQPRSPHRSFRRTYRRDYVRSLELPGYVAFTVEVWQTIWRYRVTFGLLTGTYALLSGLLVGLVSQSTYAQLGELLRTTSGDVFRGNFGKLGEAGLLLVAGMSGGINPGVSESQQLVAGLLILMTWLTTVWLLRAYLAGRHPRLQDGLYNSGAPIIPTFLLGLLLVVQLIPVTMVVLGLSAAITTGLLTGGVETMLFWFVASLLTLLSLYWITSTILAMVIVTLPGMYPIQALKTAGELVLGRRFRILQRIIWVGVISALFFAFIMIPVIMLDAWLKGVLPILDWMPLVPVSLLVMSAFMVVWTAAYIYLLYRKIVDDDTEPA